MNKNNPKIYKIAKPIVLGFLTPQDQVDYILESGSLEFVGNVIYYIDGSGNKHPSITTPNAIEVFLKKESIIPREED